MNFDLIEILSISFAIKRKTEIINYGHVTTTFVKQTHDIEGKISSLRKLEVEAYLCKIGRMNSKKDTLEIIKGDRPYCQCKEPFLCTRINFEEGLTGGRICQNCQYFIKKKFIEAYNIDISGFTC